MTDARLTPAEINEILDYHAMLEKATGPGVYALRVATPDTVEAVARQWHEHVDAALPEGYAERLVADDVAYVGASMHVRDRLAEHARGDVRRATFCQAFPPVDVLGVWSDPEPFVTAERAHGRELRAGDWVVWCDGRLL
jgi:predicted GIY-YIG superfamily endonuclease